MCGSITSFAAEMLDPWSSFAPALLSNQACSRIHLMPPFRLGYLTWMLTSVSDVDIAGLRMARRRKSRNGTLGRRSNELASRLTLPQPLSDQTITMLLHIPLGVLDGGRSRPQHHPRSAEIAVATRSLTWLSLVASLLRWKCPSDC